MRTGRACEAIEPVKIKRDATTTGLNMQDSEIIGPAPELGANISLAKMGPSGPPGPLDRRGRVGYVSRPTPAVMVGSGTGNPRSQRVAVVNRQAGCRSFASILAQPHHVRLGRVSGRP